MMLLEIFYWHNPSGRTMDLVLTQPVTEMITRNISWGWRRPVRRADNLTTFMCRLSWNLGASISWNPQGLSRSVMGLLYIYIYKCIESKESTLKETRVVIVWNLINYFNPLNPELNPIYYLLALLGVHHFLHVSRIRVKLLTLGLLMSYIYIYGAPILDVSRSHTTTQHSR